MVVVVVVLPVFPPGAGVVVVVVVVVVSPVAPPGPAVVVGVVVSPDG